MQFTTLTDNIGHMENKADTETFRNFLRFRKPIYQTDFTRKPIKSST